MDHTGLFTRKIEEAERGEKAPYHVVQAGRGEQQLLEGTKKCLLDSAPASLLQDRTAANPGALEVQVKSHPSWRREQKKPTTSEEGRKTGNSLCPEQEYTKPLRARQEHGEGPTQETQGQSFCLRLR